MNNNYLLAETSPIDFDQIQAGAFPNASPLASLTLTSFIGNILPYIFGAAAIALLIYLIIGGFQFMLSRGDPKATEAAKGKITNAIIGFIIITFAFTIVQIFGQIFGLQGTLFSQIFGGQ
jgi:hypothetical protein